MLFGTAHNRHIFFCTAYIQSDWSEIRCVLKGLFDLVVPVRAEGDWSGLKGDRSHQHSLGSKRDEPGLLVKLKPVGVCAVFHV